jgi:transcriptional regulator with XRE-family HTH domain
METKIINTTKRHIGDRIASARVLRGLSRASLARKLKVTPAQIRMYEEGKSLSADRLYHLARLLEVSVSYFYEGLSGASSSPFSLSIDGYMLLKRAMQRIAADYELTQAGHRKKLARHEAVNVARQVCEALGWDYSKKSVCMGLLPAQSTTAVAGALAEAK